MKKNRKRFLIQTALCLISLIMAAISLLPVLVLFSLAFREPVILGQNAGTIFCQLTFTNFTTAFRNADLFRGMGNSAFIAAASLILTVAFSSCASYEIARYPSRVNAAAYALFIFSMAIPAIISTVPLYILMRKLGLINTRWGMILLNVAFSMPFAIFLYTSFMKSISRDMEEAAEIDGCSPFGCFLWVLFPVLKPVTSTVVLLNAVTFWNEYGRAVFFLQKQKVYTMPLSISLFIQKYGADWELMAAAALVALVPAAGVFLMFQKYYIKGLAAGAVKG